MKINEKVDMMDSTGVAVRHGLNNQDRVALVGFVVLVAAILLSIVMVISNKYSQSTAMPLSLSHVTIGKSVTTSKSGRSSYTQVNKTVVKGYSKSGEYVVALLTDNEMPSVNKSKKGTLSTTIYKDDLNRYYASRN